MKKLFFIQLFIVISVTCMSAQLKVSSAGNVRIKLPNVTDVPISPLSIGGVGYSSNLVYLNGSGKNAVLSIINPNPIISSDRAYGINSIISGSTSYGALAIRGLADSNGSGTSGYGFGIVGEALDYHRNFGVAGALASSAAQGAGVFGSVSNSAYTETTTVRFSLPAQTKQAYICIFNLQGTMLKKTRNLVGESKVLIQGSEFKAGMYLYSLLVDGQEVDTKRMILTK